VDLVTLPDNIEEEVKESLEFVSIACVVGVEIEDFERLVAFARRDAFLTISECEGPFSREAKVMAIALEILFRIADVEANEEDGFE